MLFITQRKLKKKKLALVWLILLFISFIVNTQGDIVKTLVCGYKFVNTMLQLKMICIIYSLFYTPPTLP